MPPLAVLTERLRVAQRVVIVFAPDFAAIATQLYSAAIGRQSSRCVGAGACVQHAHDELRKVEAAEDPVEKGGEHLRRNQTREEGRRRVVVENVKGTTKVARTSSFYLEFYLGIFPSDVSRGRGADTRPLYQARWELCAWWAHWQAASRCSQTGGPGARPRPLADQPQARFLSARGLVAGTWPALGS